MDRSTRYHGIPFQFVVEGKQYLEKKLQAEEERLASEKCHPAAVYVKITANNGDIYYVARNKKWNGNRYTYTEQMLTQDLEVVISQTYTREYNTFYNLKGAEIIPLMDISAELYKKCS